MTGKEALTAFKKKMPDLTVESVHFYDNRHFMIVAKESPDKADADSPFYVVDKSTQNVYSITPTRDIDAFNYAMDHEVNLK